MHLAAQPNFAELSLLKHFLSSHSLYLLILFVLQNLLDKLLNVKQASDMPAVQKSRHRIDPDAIPSPVSFLCVCFLLCFILSFLLALTHCLLPLSFS